MTVWLMSSVAAILFHVPSIYRTCAELCCYVYVVQVTLWFALPEPDTVIPGTLL